MPLMEIAVCVCTYKRPILLDRLLTHLAGQRSDGRFAFRVVVADNDAEGTARAVVETHIPRYPVPLTYGIEVRRSISHVRNYAISVNTCELIAFIDDDEFPGPQWLLQLFTALEGHECAGVLAPVLPHYPDETPVWVIKGGFFERPKHDTGHVMAWSECRTGNVLLRRRILPSEGPVFLPEFGTGGGDVDFFRRMIGAGHVFVWCREAAVHETVIPSRWSRRVLLKRALLRGRNSLRHPKGRWVSLAKAVVAIPLYALALPILQLFGHHYFMRYMIKLCDHSGRLLAAFGIQPVKVREM
jgi:succinoglycan biosynthesis protein ExoM